MAGIKRTAADKRFSDFIRERDHWRCQRCAAQFVPPTSGLHCAHNFGRACKRCTAKNPQPHVCHRMDPSNAVALCYGCHRWLSQHKDEQEALFRGKFGDEEYERVAALAHGRRDRAS